jgi:UBX domain-containing protein 7
MMSEEEQMEAALAASLGKDISTESPATSRTQTPQTPIPVSAPVPVAQVPVPQEPASVPIGPSTSTEKSVSSVFASIAPSDVPEPPQSPQTTRIQFRFPEGGRPLVRRFNKSDTIRDVFAFVKGLRDSDEEFELVFVGRRLLAEAEEDGEQSLDRSIVDAGLANGSLTVEV